MANTVDTRRFMSVSILDHKRPQGRVTGRLDSNGSFRSWGSSRSVWLPTLVDLGLDTEVAAQFAMRLSVVALIGEKPTNTALACGGGPIRAQRVSHRRRVAPLPCAAVAVRLRQGMPSRRNRRNVASTRTVSAGG